MREIKFRGKTSEGKWEYGGIVINPRGQWFITTFIGGNDVDPETVGQYTGLKDKNGKEIYEGDIHQYENTYWVIKFGAYHDEDFASPSYGFYTENVKTLETCGVVDCQLESNYLNIIGNIHDIAELVTK